MMNFLPPNRPVNPLVWYPPAETRVPWRSFFNAFSNKAVNLRDKLLLYVNARDCVIGISARALMYQLFNVLKRQEGGSRDEILIPGYTCYSVAAAVAKSGLKIAVYDLDPLSLRPDLDSMEKAISERTLAVVAQHWFGMLTPFTRLKRIAEQYGAYLIEDAAQALGETGEGNRPGTMADFGLFSFGRGKPFPVGGGGALVAKDRYGVLKKIKLGSPEKGYRSAMVTVATQILSRPVFYWIPEFLPLGLGQTVFDTDFHVGPMHQTLHNISNSAWPILKHLNQHRSRISHLYMAQMESSHQIENMVNSISAIRFPVMLPHFFPNRAHKRLGIRKMYPEAITNHNEIRPHLKQHPVSTPGAIEISNNLYTLPTHLEISDEVARQVVLSIKNSSC